MELYRLDIKIEWIGNIDTFVSKVRARHEIMSLVKMSVALFFIVTLIFSRSACDDTGFNRDVEVYNEIIQEIQRYFQNSNIVLFYAMDNLGKKHIHLCIRFIYVSRSLNSISSLIFFPGLEGGTLLWSLQSTLSRSVFSSVMDFRSFNETVCFTIIDLVK